MKYIITGNPEYLVAISDHTKLLIMWCCGRITGLVCPSVPHRLIMQKQKDAEKTQIGLNAHQGRSNWCANFQLKRSKIRVKTKA